MKKTGRVLSLVIGLIMCLTVVFAACDTTVVVTINPKSASITVGESVSLTATASDGSAIVWSSSDEAVATVTNGVVTGVAAGSARIIASSGDVSAECAVTVTAAQVEEPDYVRISISVVILNVEVGETRTIKAIAADGSELTWESSNPAVATVSDGLVTAVAKGSAVISAKSGENSATCAVHVRNVGEALPKTVSKTLTDTVIDHTYNDYTSTVPSLWNELESTDSNNDQIMSFLGSAFFSYDFEFANGKKFNEDGSINAAGIIPGKFVTTYAAAVGLEDVTSKYAEDWGLTEEQVETGGYAWKITLRDDLAWDDGTAIFAEDFVYTMQQQLDPLFQYKRADSFYNNAVKIHNARDYVYQGQQGWFAADTPYDAYDASLVESFIFKMGPVAAEGASAAEKVQASLRTTYQKGYEAYGMNSTQSGGEYLTTLAIAFGAPLPASVSVEAINALEGKSIAEIKADDAMSATLDALLEWWDEGDDGILAFTVINYTFPAVDFKTVGIFAEGPYDIVLVLDNPLSFFKEDGITLSYNAAYSFGSLPLVKKDLYEKCKVAPQQGSDLWTSTYNTSLETSASWGEYKLTQYQAGNSYTLGRNEYWYGYALEDNKGQYQVDQIKTVSISGESAEQTAQMHFWSGQVDGLGISVTIADQYKSSKHAVFTPRIANFCINLYSNLDVLLSQGRNNGILAIKEFREAMSLSLDRASYNRELSTANKPLLGYMGEDYYYDIENGEVYRYSQQGKEALLRTYGFAQNDKGQWYDLATEVVYDDIDEAVEAMTGYNLTLAKQRFAAAWKEFTENADKYGYDSSKDVILLLGASEPSEAVSRQQKWIQKWVDTLIEGSPAEGKIKVNVNDKLGSKWSDEFEIGNYDICTGGIGNAPFDPFYMIGGAIADLGIGFHKKYWIAADVELTFKMPEGEYDGAGEELTLTLQDWYDSLNGNLSKGPSYNWGAGFCPVEARLAVVAMIEEYALKEYYSLPMSRGFTSALRSEKFHYITDDYNTMLGFGGMRYMQFDYTDAEWTAFLAAHNNDLSEFYKISD